jgi:hypothetical protein
MSSKFTRLYNRILQSAFTKSFPFWQRLGVHVTPNHFYYPIPDTSLLKDDLWAKDSELAGIDMNEANQLALLAEFSARYKQEYDALPREKTGAAQQYYVYNGTYGSVDGEILYCMIRHFKPALLFEIGAGKTTLLSAQAILENERESGSKCRFVSCEPYPDATVAAGLPGLSELRRTGVQDIPLKEFEALGENDILFIDSSHVLKIGSDVQYEYLEILPRLKKGVLVHVHDIFLPAEYPKDWIKKLHYFWNEQYLLQAFLAFNDSFEVLWAGNFMRLKHARELEAAFSSFKREGTLPGSFWMRKIK